MIINFNEETVTYDITLEVDDIKSFYSVGKDIHDVKESFLKYYSSMFDESINKKLKDTK